MTQSDSRSPNKTHTDSLATSESLRLRIKQRLCMTLKMDSRGASGNRPEWSEGGLKG